jgi:hypothetical protein
MRRMTAVLGVMIALTTLTVVSVAAQPMRMPMQGSQPEMGGPLDEEEGYQEGMGPAQAMMQRMCGEQPGAPECGCERVSWRGSPYEGSRASSRRSRVDLIIMGTHDRTGLSLAFSWQRDRARAAMDALSRALGAWPVTRGTCPP